MIKIVFLGTRGEIKPKTKRHGKHTSTLICYKGKRLLIDCGYSWLGKLNKIKPDYILLTHAHPDHAWGLKNGSPCPVYATKETWKIINEYPIEPSKKHIIKPRKAKCIIGIRFEAFPVLHSLICPAVGYRITCGSLKFFYVPDVAYIPNIEEAFKGIKFYIGDGATIVRPMIRLKGKEIFGHANIRQQLTWCKKNKVPMMIITHCGSDIVKNEKKALKQIEKLAKERKVQVRLAHDGWKIKI